MTVHLFSRNSQTSYAPHRFISMGSYLICILAYDLGERIPLSLLQPSGKWNSRKITGWWGGGGILSVLLYFSSMKEMLQEQFIPFWQEIAYPQNNAFVVAFWLICMLKIFGYQYIYALLYVYIDIHFRYNVTSLPHSCYFWISCTLQSCISLMSFQPFMFQ